MHHYIYFSFGFFGLTLSLVAFLTAYKYKKYFTELQSLEHEKSKIKKSINNNHIT